jgi:hypothetical protein
MIDEISFINHFLFHENRKKSDAGPVDFRPVLSGESKLGNSDTSVKIVEFCTANNARMYAFKIVLYGLRNGY